MIVSMSRRIAVLLYAKIVALRPDWHSDDPAHGKIKVNDYVYLSDEDRRLARVLLERGVKLLVQDVPAARAQVLSDLDPATRPS